MLITENRIPTVKAFMKILRDMGISEDGIGMTVAMLKGLPEMDETVRYIAAHPKVTEDKLISWVHRTQYLPNKRETYSPEQRKMPMKDRENKAVCAFIRFLNAMGISEEGIRMLSDMLWDWIDMEMVARYLEQHGRVSEETLLQWTYETLYFPRKQ